MKRGIIVKKLVLLLSLCLLIALLVACTTPAETTTEGTPGDSESVTTTTSATTTTQPFEPEEGTVVTEDYKATLNKDKWTSTTDIDTSKFTYFGSGKDVAGQINATYKDPKTRVWYIMNEDGTKEKSSYSAVCKLKTIGAMVETVDGKNHITVTEVVTKVQASWTSVTAKAGSYLMFDFTTNLPMEFYMTVTPTKGGAVGSAAYKQDGISVKKVANGKYTGVAKCTVPYAKGRTYYINICTNDGNTVLESIPVEITAAKYDSKYSLMFQGDWELIRDPEYLPNLIDLFYNVYPRLYARFAFGNEPKQITFMADKNYDGVAYCAGTTVCVSVDYANSHPTDLGFFSHEITHSVQQYNKLVNYGGENKWTDPDTGKVITCKSWWTENMANFGGFRYFHWGYSTKFVQIYNVKTQTNLWNWGWEPYGDGSKLFLSYIDWAYPTTDKNNDGKITTDEYGVIDLVNYTIKSSTTSFSDHPHDPNTPFNKAVATATGGVHKTMESLRQKYQSDCQSGAWFFTGFRDYKDNFRTEGLEGIPDPTYPMWEKVTPGSTTCTADKKDGVKEDTVVVPEGENLALGAKVVEFSTEISAKEGVAKAFDGKFDTLWRGSKNDVKDKKYQLQGYPHSIIIDLGAVKTFDTYVLVNAGVARTDTFNTVSWEILVSEDGRTWKSVDYQADAAADVVTVNVGTQSARYIEMRVFKTDSNNSGMLRIHEFMLFKTK